MTGTWPARLVASIPPPVPTVASVPNEPEQAVAQATPPQTPVPSVAPVPSDPGTPPSPAPTHHPPAASSQPPTPFDEGPQCSAPTETPDPPVPASAHDPANDSPTPPVSALEVDACSISTESSVPIIPIVPPATPPDRGKPSLPRVHNPLIRDNHECATLNSALAEESKEAIWNIDP